MIQYPPVTVISGSTSTANINAYPDTQAVVIYNESPYFLNITFVGSGTLSIPAYTADVYPIAGSFSGTINIMPSTYLNTTNSNPPSSVVYIQSYGSNDLLTKNVKNNVSTGYPLALVRQVSSDVANATSLTNTGYPAGNTIIFSEPQGDSSVGGTVSLTNTGVLFLGDNAYNGELGIFGVGTASITITKNSITYSSGGGTNLFTVDSNGNVLCANGETTITYGPGNETRIINNQGSDIAFYSPNASTQIGRISNGGTFKFGNGSFGSITSIGKTGLISLTTTSTAFSHSLGVTPDLVILQVNGTSSSTITTKVDYTTLSSTTFNATASASCTAMALLIKF